MADGGRRRGEESGDMGDDAGWVYTLQTALDETPVAPSLMAAITPMKNVGLDIKRMQFIVKSRAKTQKAIIRKEKCPVSLHSRNLCPSGSSGVAASDPLCPLIVPGAGGDAV